MSPPSNNRFKVADLSVQGALADHANARARILVESWWAGRAVDGGDHGGRGTGGQENATLKTVDGGRAEESDRPGVLGVLLALCGRGGDARGVLEDFAWPSSSLVEGAGDAEPHGSAAGPGGSHPGKDAVSKRSVPPAPPTVAATATSSTSTAAEDAAVVPASLTAASSLAPATPLASATSRAKLASALKGMPPSSGSLPPSSGSPPPAPYSPLKKYEEEVWSTSTPARRPPATERAEGRPAPPGGDLPSFFDDEADFLARSASQRAEMMTEEDEEHDKYIWGFSHAVPPPSAAASVPSEGSRSESERFRRQHQLQQQQWQQHRRETLGQEEVAMPPPPPPPQAQEQRAETRSAVRAQRDQGQGGVSTGASGGNPAAHSDDVREEGEAVEAARGGAETVDIIRRANLLEGGHTVVLFDLETTGLAAKSDRVIQLAGKVSGRPVQRCFLRQLQSLSSASTTRQCGSATVYSNTRWFCCRRTKLPKYVEGFFTGVAGIGLPPPPRPDACVLGSVLSDKNSRGVS